MKDSGRFDIGLVVAEPGKQISQLKRFLKTGGVDVFLFPEDFLHSDQIQEACELVGNKENGWLREWMTEEIK